MGSRAEAQSGVSRAEAQMGVGSQRGLWRRRQWVVVAVNALGASPQSLEKTGNLKGSALDQSTKSLKKRDGGGTSSRRDVIQHPLPNALNASSIPGRTVPSTLRRRLLALHANQSFRTEKT